MLDPTTDQIKIRDHAGLSLLVIAPAGCGKTEALALRIAALLHSGTVRQPRRVLVTTFTNKAKENITERLNNHVAPALIRKHVTIANFHGLAARIYRAHSNVIDMDPAALLPESDWVTDQCRKQNIPYKAAQVAKKALQSVKLDDVDDGEVASRLLEAGETLALQIENLRISENVLTYDDLPRLAALILTHQGVAELYSQHFGAIVVDEFQDLTPQQLRIINHIGAGKTTFAGDLAQGIYGFAGADPAFVYAAISNECTDRLEFSTSHRSSPAVLTAVNALAAITGSVELTAATPESWPGGGLVTRLDYDSADGEAQSIVKLCRYILDRGQHQRIGIVTRITSRRRFVDSALVGSGVPFHRWDDGVLDSTAASHMKSMLSTLNPTVIAASEDPLGDLREHAGIDTIADPDTRKAVLDAVDWVYDLLQSGERPDDIRARIRVGGTSTLLDSPGVHLLTAHAGKGQQFDWVVALGLEDGHIPYFEAKAPEHIVEEARILSVILSRARHGIFLTVSCDVPNSSGNSWHRNPSRFWQHLHGTYLDRVESARWLGDADWSQIQAK
ncbi:UvrD-helicase domain-containing protein [Rhodococcus sp. NPDC057529]|uniref:UvrD-helicase domain-containing protein n=1 Tax=Rhodococcus sp. NPDC057529 TaxID=3346158 RepID=UPI00366E6AC5